jgi:hypothetical protein
LVLCVLQLLLQLLRPAEPRAFCGSGCLSESQWIMRTA